MDGGGDGVDEALVGVGSEVDGDVGAGGDGSGDFDVEHDFTVGAIGRGGRVLATIDGDGDDGWGFETEGFEVGRDIGRPVATTEFDETDGLAGGRGVGGELVKLSDLRRGEGGAAGGGSCASEGYRSGDAEVGVGLGSIVEAEDGFNEAFERGGDHDGAFADAVDSFAVRLLGEGNAEGLLDLCTGAGELKGAGVELGGRGLDGEAELLGEAANGFDGDGIGAELRAELRTGDAGRAEIVRVDGLLAADEDGDGEWAAAAALCGGGGALEITGRKGLALAAGEGNAGFGSGLGARCGFNGRDGEAL